MPSHPSRASPRSRPAAAATPLAHDDVNAFRLRPLSYANTTPAASTTTSLPLLHTSASVTRGLAKAGPSQQHRGVAAAAAGVVESLRVSPAAAPRVYAALVPTRASHDAESAGADEAEAAAAARQRTHVSPSPVLDALVGLPVPATTCITAPDLNAVEARQLALWTRTAPTHTATATAALPLNDPLHRWWRERQTARLHERHVAALAERLGPSLEQGVRRLLTAEEHHWQLDEQHRQQQQQRVGVNHGPQTPSPVPGTKMAALLQALQLVLHQTCVSLLEAEVSEAAAAAVAVAETQTSSRGAKSGGGSGSRPAPRGNVTQRQLSEAAEAEAEDEAQQSLSRAQRMEVLQAALDTERALAAGAGGSLMLLPADRPVPAPVLRLEAAASAVLLTNVIEHAPPSTPGMEFAAHLLRHYVMPHMYIDFPGWLAVRPRLGTLSEQVTHLSTLPLRALQQQSLTAAAAQAQADAGYLEGLVKSWTMRAWLYRVVHQRQSMARQAVTERVVARLQGRVHLQRVFVAWRREAQRGQQQLRDARMQAAYSSFLFQSRQAAQHDRHAHMGTAATMATALLLYGPQPAPSSAAVLWSRPTLPPPPRQGSAGEVEEDEEDEEDEEELDVTSSRDDSVAKKPSILGTSGGGVTAVALPSRLLVADPRGGWAVAPRGSAPDAGAQVTSRQRHDTRASRRKGAGHSRVHVSFIRQKANAGAETGALLPRGSAGEDGANVSIAGRSDSASQEDANADGLMVADTMERFIVRHVSSDVGDGLGSSDEDGDPHGGTLTQLVYLESRANDISDEGNMSCVARDADGAGPQRRHRRAKTIAGGRSGGVGSGAPDHPLFQAMLSKLQEMDQVNTYLRAELAVQSRRLRKVEAANTGLQQRNQQLEDDTLRLLQEKLQALNTIQQQLVTIKRKNRRLRHFRSRLRAHRHRPWQCAILRVVGDMCEVSTAAAEGADEARVHADRYGTGGSSGDDADDDDGENGSGARPTMVALLAGADGRSAVPTAAAAAAGAASAAAAAAAAGATSGGGSAVLHGVGRAPSLVPDSENDAERLFSRIAPIVLRSARQLPDALTIVADWANSCLDDLASLDDLKDGALAERFHGFGEEARSGVLISRLLYYLALPRYRTTASAAEVELEMGMDMGNGAGGGGGARLDGIDRRRQLLEQHGVQLNPPYPVYTDCFGDLLAMPPAERMTQLLAFATELMAAQDPTAQQQGDQAWGTASTSGEGGEGGYGGADGRHSVVDGGDARRSQRASPPPLPTLSVPLPLHSVVDPYAIVRGETSAIITLVALLYIRFAHPFHHKSRQAARRERSALLQLWSGGSATAAEMNGVPSTNAFRTTAVSDAVPGLFVSAPPSGYSIEADMLRQLPPEDKTAWQLFRERCLPVFGTQAHAFLLRGGFWPSEAFESPELAAMLSTLAMALRRSLELHRWHVTLHCLVPVRTYSGLTRGVFTGPSASAQGLLLGLRQDGKEGVDLEHAIIYQCVEQRQQAYLNALVIDPFTSSLTSLNSSGTKAQQQQQQQPLPDAATETQSLTTLITGVWLEDLLSLFTQRANLSAQLALPVLDLGGWRMLFSDLGLISMASPDRESFTMQEALTLRQRESSTQPQVPRQPRPQLQAVDMEVATELFQRGVMAVALARGEVDPAVLQPTRAVNEAAASPPEGFVGADGDRVQQRPSRQPAAPQPLPAIQMDMTFTSFIVALVLLAHRLYPALVRAPQIGATALPTSSPAALGESGECAAAVDLVSGPLGSPVSATLDGDASASRPQPVYSAGPPTYCPLHDAFTWMMQGVVLPSSAAHLQSTDPQFILHHLTRGVKTQAVLHSCAPALLLVYQSYSKEVFGDLGMVREDVLRLLRDAMLTSTEISQYLIYELFASCAVSRQASEEVATANRKEMDRLASTTGGTSTLAASVSSSSRRPGYRAVRIVDPDTASDSVSTHASTQRRRLYVLTFDGFCDLLCVLCGFKLPNVFVPFDERLHSFLRRSVLRPLTHMVSGLAPLLSRSQLPGVSTSAVSPAAPTAASAINNNSLSATSSAAAAATGAAAAAGVANSGAAAS
ncbi:hypothetical protein NESM_000126100 [Novymonas esmeraldas]|uniref:Uncharacterized protein n=1 Tax=Novymonas esmeraldas TaxID=1808958 RepID=A0AAW0F4U8_9TRYP